MVQSSMNLLCFTDWIFWYTVPTVRHFEAQAHMLLTHLSDSFRVISFLYIYVLLLESLASLMPAHGQQMTPRGVTAIQHTGQPIPYNAPSMRLTGRVDVRNIHIKIITLKKIADTDIASFDVTF